MANRMERAVPGRLRVLFEAGTFGDLTDGQLLERSSTETGEEAELAFATLVERHGPMVLRACRGVLADPHDAQDAFQATFLVLIRKARGLWVRDSLGPWLHQVAYRTAASLRSSTARRRRHEHRAAASPPEGDVGRDEEPIRMLHEEIERLPERFRVPLVLCDLQGCTGEQAARHLGWPIGTIKSRLSRARRRLRDRLVRRGLSPNGGLLVAACGPGRVDLPVPAALAESTARAVARFVATRTFDGGFAAILADGVHRAMITTRAVKVASLLLVLGATVSSAGLLARMGGPGGDPPQDEAARDDRGDGSPFFEVRPGTLRVEMTERGSLESDQGPAAISEVDEPTTVVSILPEGTRVRKGDVVCELDSAGLRDGLLAQEVPSRRAEGELEEVRKEVEVAGLDLRDFEQISFPLREQAGEGRVAVAGAEVAASRLRAEKVDREAGADEVAKAEARVALLQAEQGLRQAEGELRLLREYDREKELRRLRTQVAKAQSHVPAREAASRLEKSREATIRKQVEACTIHAPADGMVVYSASAIERGATVRRRQGLFSVFDPAGPMRVNVKVPEAVVDRLTPGLRARIEVDAFPGREFWGTIKQVAPLPDAPGPGSDFKVYTTLVALDEGFPSLRPGMTAKVEIHVARLDDVLSVPVQAVLIRDGKEHVAVEKPGGGIDWREVALGTTNDEVVEVKRGVAAGERVAREPASLLSEEEKRRMIVGEKPRGALKSRVYRARP